MGRPHHPEPGGRRERENRQDAQKELTRAVPGILAARPGPGVHRPQISLINADLTGLPPTSVYYGEYETLAGEGAELGRRLADFKVTSEVHPMPEGQHTFILSAGRVPETDQAIGRIGQWVRRHLGA
jgi:epsilon-lactone hydrolase